MGLKANEWQSLQGGLADGATLTAVARGEQIDCFVRGTDGGLWRRSWDGQTWAEWQNLGGVMTASPTAVSGAADGVDCFVRGTDNGLWQRSMRGDRWLDWVKLDGSLAGTPGAVTHEGGRIDVFVRGSDGALWCRSFDGASWAAWYSLQGGLASDPVVVSSRPNYVNVFVKGTDGAMWIKSWDVAHWFDWISLGGGIQEEPAVLCRGNGLFDCLVRGLDNHRLWSRQSDSVDWLPWTDLAGGLASKPAVTARGTDGFDVFVRGTDGALWRRTWKAGRWTEWESLGGQIVSPPVAVTTSRGEVVVFAMGSDKALWWRHVVDAAIPVVTAPTRPAGVRPANVIDASALVGVAVERLNRQSVLALLQQMVQEIDEHCRTFPGMVDVAIVNLRNDLLLQIEALRVAIEKYHVEIGDIYATLIALKTQYGDFMAKFETTVGGIVVNNLAIKLPDIITQVHNSLDVTIQQKIDAAITRVDISALLVKLEELNLKIELLKKSAEELDAGELKQVEILLQKLILNIDLSSVLVNMRVEVNGVQFRLDELLKILAGGDKVVQINFTYNVGDLVGARFVLVDNTVVTFVCNKYELLGGEVDFVFQTLDWKGVPASFSIRFKRNTLRLSLCKKDIGLDTYDVLYQTNIVFNLVPEVKVPEEKPPRVTAPPPEEKPEPKLAVCETVEPIAPVVVSKPEPEPPPVALERPAPAPELQIINGSFEEGPEPGLYQSMKPGDAQIVGWTVGGGGVDYIGTHWQPGDSLRRSIDLNGLAPGSVEQVLRTTPGHAYRVTFMMAGNPGGAPTTKTMLVSATGGSDAPFTFSTKGKSYTNMGWLEKTYTFKATSSTTVLKFVSTTTGAYGPVIDAVSIARLKATVS